MPGTFGTLWGVAGAYLISGLSLGWRGAATVAVALAAISVCAEASRALKAHDHPSIVADEAAGYLVAIFLLPFTAFNAILVFILFRFFDIVKPWPAGVLDRQVKGGVGIVLDDIAAGVYAGAAAHAVIWLIGKA